MDQVKTQNNSVANKDFPSPGAAGPERRKKRSRTVSEYKKSLQEKQTLKRLYHLRERQFKKYVQQALSMKKIDNMPDELIKNLERRLDSIVFRMGFAKSQVHSRQLVSHAYFLVNGKPINIPSFKLKIGDVVAVKETKKKKGFFSGLQEVLKKAQLPSWIEVNKEKLEGKLVSYPTLVQINPPAEIQLIFEFYSR